MIFAFACAMAITASATKLTQGSLDALKGQRDVTVVFDLSKTVYDKNKTVDDFMKKYYRLPNWMEISLNEFVKEFNEHAYRMETTVTTTAGGKYQMTVTPATLTKGGKLTDVTVVITDKTSGQTIATLTMDSKDGDSDDEKGLKDAMEDLGEQLGKFFNKQAK